MSGVNKVILVGNLGQDPEIRYLQNGDAVANFSIATSEKWKDKNSGETKEATEWHRCVAWRKQAETIGQYAQKGSKLYVEGKLQTRKWEQDGQTKYSTEIQVNQFQFLSPRSGGGGAPQQQAPQQHQAPQQDSFKDDIPF